ncbi:hypothetical protein HETIRDRAFT_315565 [Heterobasidion irregulare TC 32-1]|uniref:Uncharacterized protein n=1 Tax=Heterobasidion irregulare (strain TC 32-1) TaxID=747525 RepID=W4K9Z6_HETIT|nr:uncharacterized protein HETIRDRAFT_315565 [Heterobasidion irregulare TC 32-1]ETW82574.1 hypothetical protein HETIRDRAFT_315565 [Heterobasidion irregulare TC 32-1]
MLSKLNSRWWTCGVSAVDLSVLAARRQIVIEAPLISSACVHQVIDGLMVLTAPKPVEMHPVTH